MASSEISSVASDVSVMNPRVFAELLTKVRGGDSGAWDALCHQYKSVVRTVVDEQVSGVFRTAIDRSQLTHATLRDARQELAEFRGDQESQWVEWLISTTTRNAKAALEEAAASPALAETVAATPRTPLARLIVLEPAPELETWLKALPEMPRLAVRLRYWEGLPIAEMARQMNCTEPAAAGWLLAGLRAIQSQLP